MYSGSYLLLIVVTLAIGGLATGYVNRQLKKYSTVASATQFTGAQIAQCMLNYHGVTGCSIRCGAEGQDHFDPRTNSISLSPSVYNRCSVTAIATACHEVGHACQFAQGYAPMKARSALVPVVNLASNSWMILLCLGIFLNMVGFIKLAVVMYMFAVLFQIVTLPVEFNASSRALAYLKACNIPAVERDGAGSVLRACAFTYVAAALTSILQLLWLLGQARD